MNPISSTSFMFIDLQIAKQLLNVEQVTQMIHPILQSSHLQLQLQVVKLKLKLLLALNQNLIDLRSTMVQLTQLLFEKAVLITAAVVAAEVEL